MADAYTKLLLHCDGADESTDITDSGVTGHEISVVATAMLDTGWKEFGTASLEVDGDSDYITAPDHADWNFTGDFTIDFVVKHAAVSKRQCYFNQWDANTREWSFELDVNNKIWVWHYYNGAQVNIRTTNAAITDTNKHHVAIVRSGNTCYVFVDGVSQALTTTTAFSGALTDITSDLWIGANNYNGSAGEFVDGHMDEVRVSKGIARWTSNFTPPNVAYDSALVEPTTLAAEATLQTPSLAIGALVTPAALAAEASLHAPTPCFDFTVTPATLAAIATLQTPVTINILHPGSFSALATLHAPTLIFDCTVTPSTLAAIATLQTPLIVLDMIVTPVTLTALATLQTPEALVYYPEIPDFMHQDLIDPYSGGAWLWLCEIAVPGYDTKRIARDTKDLVYGGEDFEKFNMQIGEQMFSGDGSIPRVTLRVFQDVNRIIEDMVNATEGALGASVKLIRVCEKYLDTPVAALEADYDNLASESDTEWVTFTLGIPNPLTQRIPLRIYSSSSCPSATPTLFKGPECQYSGGDGTCSGTYEDCYVKGNAVHWGGELGLDPNVVRV